MDGPWRSAGGDQQVLDGPNSGSSFADTLITLAIMVSLSRIGLGDVQSWPCYPHVAQGLVQPGGKGHSKSR